MTTSIGSEDLNHKSNNSKANCDRNSIFSYSITDRPMDLVINRVDAHC